jgi:hypothetical protein
MRISRETLVGEGMTFEIPRVTAVPTLQTLQKMALLQIHHFQQHF